jgi:hypothetical protein
MSISTGLRQLTELLEEMRTLGPAEADDADLAGVSTRGAHRPV